MPVVVALHGAVGGLVLEAAFRRDENGGHHGEAAAGGRDKVRQDVAVVVLEGPEEPSLGADRPCRRVVDEGEEVLDARRVEFRFPARFIFLPEDVAEPGVIDLGDGVLRAEPQVDLFVQGEGEAGAGEVPDRLVGVVDPLQDARPREVGDLLPGCGPPGSGREHEHRRARAGDGHLRVVVDVPVGVTADHDGPLPARHEGSDILREDGLAEDGPVEHGPDCAVGALPHLLQPVLGDTVLVGGDRGALDAHAVPQDGLGRLHRHPVVRFVPALHMQVVILELHVQPGVQELFLHQGPHDARHLVTVHLDDGVLHSYFPDGHFAPFPF